MHTYHAESATYYKRACVCDSGEGQLRGTGILRHWEKEALLTSQKSACASDTPRTVSVCRSSEAATNHVDMQKHHIMHVCRHLRLPRAWLHSKSSVLMPRCLRRLQQAAAACSSNMPASPSIDKSNWPNSTIRVSSVCGVYPHAFTATNDGTELRPYWWQLVSSLLPLQPRVCVCVASNEPSQCINCRK